MWLDGLASEVADKAVRRRPGVAVGLIAGGEQATAFRNVAEDALFEIGSTTKVFTAQVLGSLIDEGRVGLYDRLRDHLDAPVPVHPLGEITLEHLATHTSGLPRDPRGTTLDALRRGQNPYAALDAERIHCSLAKTKLRSRPGARVRYSNIGVGLLGHALEAGGGAPYERLLRERVLEPLGMRDTLVGTPPPDATSRLAVGHNLRGKPVEPFQIPGMLATGAIRSTLADMLRFARACLDGDRLAAFAQAPRRRIGRRAAIGLCWHWMALGRSGLRVVWHNGGTIGFSSFLGLVPDRSLGVVMLTNSRRLVDRGALGALERAARSRPV